MKYLYFYCLLILTIMFSGCSASKTPLIKPTKKQLKDNGLIIGSLSRNSGKAYFRESSITIVDANKTFVKNVYNQSEDMSLKSITKPFVFYDDFKENNRSGSVFSFLLPKGEYHITKPFTGSTNMGYSNEFIQKISIENGTYNYIGDFKFEPTKTTNDNWIKNEIPLGVKLDVSNQLKEDLSIYQQYLNKSLQTEDIRNYTKNKKLVLKKLTDNPRLKSKIHVKRKEKEPLHPVLGVLLVEGLLISNAWMASEKPKEYGGFMMLFSPIAGSSGDKFSDYVGLVGAEAIGLYNLTIDKDKKTKSDIFKENLIGWHIVIGVGALTDYFTDDKKEDSKVYILPIKKGGVKISYNYRF